MKHLSFFGPHLPTPPSEMRRLKRARYYVFVTLLAVFLVLPAVLISGTSASKLKAPFGPKSISGETKAQSRKAKASTALVKPTALVSKLFPTTHQPLAILPQAPVETMTTYADDCTTPKTDFLLGETVCAKVANAPGSSIQAFYWSNASNFLVQNSPILTTSQDDNFVLPATNTSTIGTFTANNRGTWKITAAGIDDGAARAIAFITVTNPAEAAADLSVFKFTTSGSSTVTEGTNVTFALQVANVGPNDAANVTLTDSTPTNMTLVSLVENAGGAGFSCTGSACTIASLPKDGVSSFTATYAVDSVATQTVSSYSASVASDLTDPESPNNTASGEVTITVTGAPTACTVICPQNINANANTTEGGVRGAHVTFAAPESDGDCGAITATPASGSFFPEGTTTVNVTSETGGGSCSFTVTVTDTGVDPPTISCPAGVEVTANSNCEASVTVGTTTTSGTNVTVFATRSDGKPMYDCDANGENCVRKSQDLPFPAGVTTVTWTATAHSGLPATENNETGNASCTQTIIVDDVVAPTINATPQTASADASCQAVVPDFTATATVSDNCACSSSDTSETCDTREPITVTQSPAPGTIVGLGPHTITLTANDGSSNNNGAGNTATTTTTFTVNDTTAPTITAPADSSAFADASCLAAVPDYRPGTTASDNCGSVTLSQSPAPGTLVGYGPHTVTVTADDGRGNTASDDVVFTVNDNTPPTITAPADSSAFANASCLAAVPDYRPGTTAADNCGSVTLSQSPAPGTLVGYGPHTVTVTANDGHGNTASDTVVFTVNDNTPPVFTSCPVNITIEATCPTGAKATYATPTATDNCGVTVTRTTGPASGAVFPIGTTTVVHTADDGHGNTATCTFTVTVLTPQAILQNLINSVNASSLTGTQKNGLLAKLNAALTAINSGQQNVACNKLSEFVNSVGVLINNGSLTAAQGNAWISSANNVRNTIGCTNNPCT